MSFKVMKTHQQDLYLDPVDMDFVGSTGNDIPYSNYVVQIFIFYGENFLGWDCFQKDTIAIGSNEGADLILVGEDIEDFHALVQVKGDQILITDTSEGKGHISGGRPVKDIILGSFDFITIGPYALKIKVKSNDDSHPDQDPSKNISDMSTQTKPTKPQEEIVRDEITVVNSDSGSGSVSEIYKRKVIEEASSEDEAIEVTHVSIVEDDICESLESNQSNTSNIVELTKSNIKYNLFCNGRLVYGRDPKEVKENLTVLLKVSEKKVDRLLSASRTILKKNINFETADKLRKRLEAAGILVSIEPIHKVKKQQPKSDDEDGSPIVSEPVKPEIQINPVVSNPFYTEEDDDEEEEEEDLEADFLLFEKLIDHGLPEESFYQDRQSVAEVIKYQGGQVIDVVYIEEGEAYYASYKANEFCLVENKGNSDAQVYFQESFKGTLKENGTETDIGALNNRENDIHSETGLYRTTISEQSELVIEDGGFTYHIRLVKQGKTGTPKELPTKTVLFKNFLLKSAAFHLVVLILSGIIHLVNPDIVEKQQSTHFVRMSIEDIKELNKKIPPPVKKVPVKVKEKKKQKNTPKPIIKNKTKKKTVKKNTPSNAKQASKRGKQAVSKSPKAGGGFGKGNVATRNVNEAGILGILGSTSAPSTSNALAQVTNLEAVSSPHSDSGNFKVGGIVGKLGTSKIAITSPGQSASTKGGKQVLRSYGKEGEGTIAALEKGNTGQKKVVGLVKASLTQKVRIRGGMSREAVKKVIDAHLDEISYCYETALLSNPSIIGKVVFEWKILTSGRVGEVKIKTSSINSSQIHSCIKSCIKSWQFPEPKGNEVIVSYPFIFDIVGF